MTATPERFTHLLADFVGVPAAQAGDAALLSGLLIAAAGGAGLAASGTPAVHMLPAGTLTAFLLLDGCHMALHTFPEHGLVLADEVTSPIAHKLWPALRCASTGIPRVAGTMRSVSRPIPLTRGRRPAVTTIRSPLTALGALEPQPDP